MYINLTWNCRVCVGVVFLCLLCARLASLTTLESIDQQHFAKTNIRYISLSLNFIAIIGRPITSYYCVILKMVILRDVIKTIQNGVCVIFKEQKPVFLQKKENTGFKKKRKKQVGWGLKKTRVFLKPGYLSILFCDFPLIEQSGTTHITISLVGCAPHT